MNFTFRLRAIWGTGIFLCSCILLLCSASGAQTVPAPAPPQVSNAAPRELDSIEQLMSQLDTAIGTRYPNALKFYGLTNIAPQYPTLISHTRITHLAVSPTGALARVHYEVSGKSGSSSSTSLKSGTLDIWLKRQSDGFAFTSQVWIPPLAPETLLVNAAAQARAESSTGILQLIVERHGGRWIPLRQMRWRGKLASDKMLTQLEHAQQITSQTPVDKAWIAQQLARYDDKGPGTVHLFFQSGNDGWVGIGSARHDAPDNPASAIDKGLEIQRQQVNGASFISASAHRDFGKALAGAGLYVEAATQLEQASALSPASVDTHLLAQVKKLRSQDPEMLAAHQLQNEARIGLDPTHPTYQINALIQQFSRDPNPLGALRLGVEYSQLGDDDRAAQMLQQAETLLAGQGMDRQDSSDQAWIKVLLDHLQERTRDAALKPPNLIRSSLFTVRCWIDDPHTLPLLAALENAQHTVYADFNIPMNNTEVLLWPTQTDFQRYTTRFSETAHSEFVTALTLTKLINTRQGPLVLGEEMNVYSGRNTTWFSTVAHEYGHVAVRQMSRARDVPTWLNEGIACAVEGGYEGYKPRLHRAAQNNALLSMDDLLDWQVDGERAFLAYSEANSLVDYIVARWGGNALLQILRFIGNDMTPGEAFTATLQMDQYQLWQAWRRDGVP